MNDRVSEQQAQQDRALALMALTLDPQPPPPALRARLLASASARGRYLPFLEPLAAEFDLETARMRELLESAATAEPWQKGLLPGFALIHFVAGPRVVERHAGFARMPAGFEIPLHRHAVEEYVFVLEGLLVQDDGTMVGPGEFSRHAPGSAHAVSVVEDAVVASLVGLVEPA